MKKNALSVIDQMGLTKPGDTFFARITPTGRQVIKQSLDGGKIKRSITRYPTTGTIVATQSIKPT